MAMPPLWCRCFLLCAFGVALLWAMWQGAAPIDANYTAAELLDITLRWLDGGALYPASIDTTRALTNYPPLYFWGVKILVAAGCTPLCAGRLLTTFGVFLALAMLWRLLRSACVTPRQTAWALCFLAITYPPLFLVSQFHLQWLTVGCTLLGVWAITAPHVRWRIVLAASALAASVFCKQTQVVTIAIIALWLARYHRRALPLFLSVGAVCAVIGWFTLIAPTGAWPVLTTYSVGTMRVGQWTHAMMDNVLPLTPLLGFALWLGWKSPDARHELRWWYCAGLSAWVIAAALREGFSGPNFIEWICALLWWSAPTAVAMLARGVNAEQGTARAWRWALGAQIVLGVVSTDARLLYSSVRLAREVNLLPTLCAALPHAAPVHPVTTPDMEVRALADPAEKILTENIAMVRACGRVPALHPFLMTNLAQRGLWNQHAFVAEIAAGRFAALLLPFSPAEPVSGVHAERWTPEMLTAMARGYEYAQQFGRLQLWLPRQ